MKIFFLMYWMTFIAGYLTWRSYNNYYRRSVLRHQYAERHRRQLTQSRRGKVRLFQ
ncbi:MAG: hypothetical protein ACD_28C00158G0004 [uncultured bacterium]|nr:MAG: hypothetical protein ACD_28C00158G0004 [uncultured bacterium]